MKKESLSMAAMICLLLLFPLNPRPAIAADTQNFNMDDLSGLDYWYKEGLKDDEDTTAFNAHLGNWEHYTGGEEEFSLHGKNYELKAESGTTTLTLDNAVICNQDEEFCILSGGYYYSCIIVEPDAVLNLVLTGDNYLIAGDDNPAIEVKDGGILTIGGSGNLYCMGGEDGGAGIGEEASEKAGAITVSNNFTGKLYAVGRNGGAGIGGGADASFEFVSIQGGNVYAFGGKSFYGSTPNYLRSGTGAGIGTGAGAHLSSGRYIHISGNAHVEAYGGDHAAGIGTGYSGDMNASSIFIEGAPFVYSAGYSGGAGIGTGLNGKMPGSYIKILGNNSSNIQALGSLGGAGIGTGQDSPLTAEKSDIQLFGGNINARGGSDSGAGGPGIGYGKGSEYVTSYITIKDANVTAIGGNGAAGIGGGSDVAASQGPNAGYEGGISIHSGNVYASGANGGAGIGSGVFCQGGFVEIWSGTVYASGPQDIGGGPGMSPGVLYLDHSTYTAGETPPVVFLESGHYPATTALGITSVQNAATIAAATHAESNTIFERALPGGLNAVDDVPALALAAVATITLNTNGGSSVAPIIANIGSTLQAPVTTQAHINFVGWCADEALMIPVAFPYTVTGNATWYAKWGDYTYYETNTGSGKAMLYEYLGRETEMTLPSTLPSLSGSGNWEIVGTCGTTFGNKSLTSVVIPNSYTTIWDWTFAGNLLTSVILPSNLSEIGGFAFRDNSLSAITIPPSVSHIGNNAFINNILTSFVLPASPTGYTTTWADNHGNAYLPGDTVTQLTYAYTATRHPFPTGVSVVPAALNVDISQSAPITAIVVPEGAEQEVIWSSNNQAVAVVNADGRVTGVSLGAAVITATSKFDSEVKDTCVVTVYAKPTGLELSQATLDITLDESTALTADILPSSARQDAVWSSSNTNIAEVDSNGLVSAKGVGTAIITASAESDNTKQAECVVTVHYADVSGIALSETTVNVDLTETAALTSTVEPSNADQAVTWSSNNEAIATVDTNGVVTGQGVGTAVITATSAADNTKKAVCTVTVEYADPTGLSLSPTDTAINIGETALLSATVAPPNASQDIVWSSFNEAVATVNASGVVTGKGEGNTSIMAESMADQTLRQMCNIRIYAAPTAVNLSETTIEVILDETMDLGSEVIPSNAQQDVVWSSSNPSVATVDADGLVTGAGIGTASISAVSVADASKQAVCSVTVKYADPVKITISSEATDIVLDETVALTTSIEPYNALQTVTWSSNAESIATVDASGLVTAVGVGQARISARSVADNHYEGVCIVTVDYPDPTGVTLSQSSANIDVTQQISLSASISPENASQQIIWSSSNPDVATVNDSGRIQGVAYGTATITAKSQADQTKLATCEVHVYDRPTGIKVQLASGGDVLNNSVTHVTFNEPVTFSAVVEPGTALQEVAWSSEDVSIATIDTNGVFTGIRPNLITHFNVRTTNKFEFSKSTRVGVIVEYADPTRVVLSQSNAEINISETITLSAVVEPDNACQTTTWGSGNTHVAMVDENGKVMGIGAGTAVIYAFAAYDPTTYYAACTVTVYPQPTEVTLSRSTANMYLNETVALTASVAPLSAQQGIIWSSSNTNVATVDSSGVVTARGGGTATITAASASDAAKKATCDVTVEYPDPTGVTLSQATASIALRDTVTLTASVQPSDANQAVTWMCNNEAIATVDSNGVVTGTGIGTAIITALTEDDHSKFDTCRVTVDYADPSGVSLQRTATVLLGRKITLTGSVQPAGARQGLTWSSADARIATVDATGEVTGLGEGVVHITAASEADPTKSSICTVTVSRTGSSGGSSGGEAYAAIDSDGDGISDSDEAAAGSDPHNSASTPGDINGDGIADNQKTPSALKTKAAPPAPAPSGQADRSNAGGASARPGADVPGDPHGNPSEGDAEERKENEAPMRGIITGVLMNGSHEPLVGILVTLHSELRTTVTDRDGRFVFEDVVLTPHLLTIYNYEHVPIGEYRLLFEEAEQADVNIDGSVINTTCNLNRSVMKLQFSVDESMNGVELTGAEVMNDNEAARSEYKAVRKTGLLEVLLLICVVAACARIFIRLKQKGKSAA